MKFKVFPASAAYDSIKQSNADQRAHEYNDRQEGGVRNEILDLYVSDGFTDTDMYVWLWKEISEQASAGDQFGGRLQDLHVHEK